MRCVYQADQLIDAHLVLHRLQAAGIEAQVLGGYLTGGIGELPVMGLLQVVVADNDVELALQVLDEFAELRAPAVDDSEFDAEWVPATG